MKEKCWYEDSFCLFWSTTTERWIVMHSNYFFNIYVENSFYSLSCKHISRGLQFAAKQRKIQTEWVTTEIVEIFPIQLYAIIDLFCVDWERITKCELFSKICNRIEHSHVSFNWIDVWKLCSASSFTFNLNSEWNEDKEFVIMEVESSINWINEIAILYPLFCLQ